MTAAAIAEAGVLVAHHQATARLLPKEVRTITGGETQSSTITIPTGEVSSYLLIRQQLIPVYSLCPPWESVYNKVTQNIAAKEIVEFIP
ncbi:hypothetical protein AVEN_153699-1 [Araneus ventricosus]|uniref:Uncharacterized protein n=1 Tax=Araneus ventricosus TaxID=182803 RepID=A0A4Y2G4B2_ARAVE|nr:hypothetical protein AVEN_153699-1 [Araneus ventricosus]